jgi:hypothetical protein
MIERLQKEIREREELIKQIRKECTHPESAVTVEPTSVRHSVYEDGDDGYIGGFVDKTLVGERHHCELCGSIWTMVDGKVWTRLW